MKGNAFIALNSSTTAFRIKGMLAIPLLPAVIATLSPDFTDDIRPGFES